KDIGVGGYFIYVDDLSEIKKLKSEDISLDEKEKIVFGLKGSAGTISQTEVKEKLKEIGIRLDPYHFLQDRRFPFPLTYTPYYIEGLPPKSVAEKYKQWLSSKEESFIESLKREYADAKIEELTHEKIDPKTTYNICVVPTLTSYHQKL
ncbi:MAG: hypothetical protein GXN99_02680, partial [Candidatus Nanohaloarchaeota archaeon]|nr:hypothetical protein [Candidatus Nanohaloarchaeota archaeon]